MRVIIAGSRNGFTLSDIRDAVYLSGFKISVVISGTAGGVDRLGEAWAKERNIQIERFPAKWKEFGKSAGYKRNEEMAKNAEALIALWDGESRGTKHMIDIATRQKLKIYVFKRELES